MRSRVFAFSLCLVLGVVLIGACRGGGAVQPPPDSPLAQVRPGDGQAQVIEKLGEPGDRASGFQYRPYGASYNYEVWYYKGLGTVWYRNNGPVHHVAYDPGEDGTRN